MSEVARLRARIEELEALCGLPGKAAPNPFKGEDRRRLNVIASLLLKRDRVSYEAIGLATGATGGVISNNYASSYVSRLRKQLPEGLSVLRESGVGYYVNDKAKLAAFLRGETAR